MPVPTPVDSFCRQRRRLSLLGQATFGATEAQANELTALGDPIVRYAKWIDQQMAPPVSTEYAYVQAAYQAKSAAAGFAFQSGRRSTGRIWFQNAVNGPDQLRQRVAWALSQIMVVPQVSLANYPFGTCGWLRSARSRRSSANFRQLLQDVTLHSSDDRAILLNMRGNRQAKRTLAISGQTRTMRAS